MPISDKRMLMSPWIGISETMNLILGLVDIIVVDATVSYLLLEHARNLVDIRSDLTRDVTIVLVGGIISYKAIKVSLR